MFHNIHMPHLRRAVWVALLAAVLLISYLIILLMGPSNSWIEQWIPIGLFITAPAIFVAFLHRRP